MYTTKLKNQVKSVFLTKNGKINQYTYKDQYLAKKGHLDFKNYCMTIIPFAKSIQEFVYCILNDFTEPPKCECSKYVKFNQYSKGYRQYCSVKCRANSIEWETTKQKTNIKKYGVCHAAQQSHEREKRSILLKNIDRSSWDYSSSVKKIKKTILERYGDVNTGWLSNGRQTRIKNNFVSKDKTAFKEYRKHVDKLTELNDLSVLENYELRDNHCYNKDAYHLDHIVSVVHCFNAGVHPEICASIYNLRFIPWQENLSKWAKSDMSVDDLIGKYNEKIL